MKPTFSSWSTVVMAIAVPVWLLAVAAPASGQRRGASGSRGGGAQAESAGGGGQASGGGGGSRSSGERGSGARGGGEARSGGRDYAVPRGGEGRDASGGTQGAAGDAPRSGESGTPAASPDAASSGGGRTGSRSEVDGNGGRRRSESGSYDQAPPYSRPREGRPRVGVAVPRTQAPPPRGGGRIYNHAPGGYYGRYYGGYYPWGFGGLNTGYDLFFDPWWSAGYSTYYPQYYPPSSYTLGYEGALRLKLNPPDASVSVDGYYVGIVDDFDGVFQRLHIESGPHRIEIQSPGYEVLSFEVMIQPGRTLTYRGELRRLP